MSIHVYGLFSLADSGVLCGWFNSNIGVCADMHGVGQRYNYVDFNSVWK